MFGYFPIVQEYPYKIYESATSWFIKILWYNIPVTKEYIVLLKTGTVCFAQSNGIKSLSNFAWIKM